MIKQIRNWLLLAASLTAGCAMQNNPSVDVEEASRMADNKETFILDVRTPAEYADGHLANSVLVPLQEIERRANDLPADKNRPILVYCRSGNRSGRAQQFLRENGYANVFNLKGGILAWTADQKTLVK